MSPLKVFIDFIVIPIVLVEILIVGQEVYRIWTTYHRR